MLESACLRNGTERCCSLLLRGVLPVSGTCSMRRAQVPAGLRTGRAVRAARPAARRPRQLHQTVYLGIVFYRIRQGHHLFSLLAVIGSMIYSLVIALLLNRNIPARGFSVVLTENAQTAHCRLLSLQSFPPYGSSFHRLALFPATTARPEWLFLCDFHSFTSSCGFWKHSPPTQHGVGAPIIILGKCGRSYIKL